MAIQQVTKPKEMKDKKTKLETFATMLDTGLNLASLGQNVNKSLIQPFMKKKNGA